MASIPPRNMVTTLVSLSRCLYAQLALQEYDAPKGWLMPDLDAPDFQPALLGAKLAAGFEIVCSHLADVDDAPQASGQGEQVWWSAYASFQPCLWQVVWDDDESVIIA